MSFVGIQGADLGDMLQDVYTVGSALGSPPELDVELRVIRQAYTVQNFRLDHMRSA